MQPLFTQIRRLIPVLLIVYIPVTLILAVLVLIWYRGGDISHFTRDPLAIVETELLKIQREPDAGIHDLARLNLPFYIGTVSNLGVLLWCGTAAIALFAAAFGTRPGNPYPRGMFVWVALISAVFLFDDLFLLHERALPVYFGLSEKWLFAVYALTIAGFLLRYWRAILKSDYLLLGLAFGLFAMSLGIDLIPNAIPQPHFFEDGAKFAGIAAWTAYHVRNAAATE